MKLASGEIAEFLREAYSANAKGATDYGAKAIEISRANTGFALQFMADLVDTKSRFEAISLSATQSCKSLELPSSQNSDRLSSCRRSRLIQGSREHHKSCMRCSA